MQKFSLVTDKDKIEVVTASSWHELTLSQLVDIEGKYKDDLGVLRAFSILTGITLEVAENLTDKNIEQKVNQIVGFLGVNPDWQKLKRPKAIYIDGKPYIIPTKIGALKLGQKIMLQQLSVNDENIIQIIPKTIAIIMQPHIDKQVNKGELKYSHERVAALEKKILKSNGLHCYSLATFFFRKLKNTVPFGTKNLKKSRPLANPMKRLSKNWLKLTGSTDIQALAV